MSVQEYLEKHLLSRKIEEAVNAAVRAKAPDPVLFIAGHMRRAAPAVITRVRARQILDGHGAPAVEVELHTNKAIHRASAAGSGALEGAAADAAGAAERRKILAKVVADSVRMINDKVSEALVGMDPQEQSQIDQAIMDLNKARHKVHSEILSLSPICVFFSEFCIAKPMLYSVHKQLMAPYAQAILYIGTANLVAVCGTNYFGHI
jgi:enolase